MENIKNMKNYYIYDYVIMTYRIFTGKIDHKTENKLVSILHTLLDEFGDEYVHNLVNEDKIK